MMKDIEYEILKKKNSLLESENKRLKLDIENGNKLLIGNQQKSTNQNFNSQILDNISAGIYLIETKTGNILYANPTFEKMFGYETDELVGKNVSIVNAETKKPAKDVAFDIIQKLEQFGHWEGEVANIKKDGTVFYCEATVSTFEHSEYGTVWVSIHKDITELKSTQVALKESENRFQLIANHSNNWEVFRNGKGELIYSSPAFEKLTGYKNADLLSGKITYRDYFHPDEVGVITDNIKFSLKGHKINEFETRIFTKEGVLKHISINVHPVISDEGLLVGHRASVRDISERIQAEQALIESEQALKASELRWKFAIEGNSDGLWDWNLINDKVFMSAQCKKMLGFSEKEISGRIEEWYNRIHPDDKEKTFHDNNKHINGETDSYENEHRLLCKDNSYKWILDRGKIISYTPDKKPERMIGTISDISERKMAEQALKESETELKELNATKDKLFAIIAHDLRSPFNTILGFSELLIVNVNEVEVAELERYLGFINSSAKNTLILLDNLLNWAKSQTGQIKFQPKKINLSSILREVIELKNSYATIKNITIIQKQSDEVEVYADEDLLKTVLRNLISNAIKFTNSGGNINIFKVIKQHQVEITISDNGVGMNNETRKKLFNVSAYETSPGTAKEKGSGLGLVLCKEFVEKLGGNIWVESEEGKGSDFKFTLPLNRSSE